MTHNVHQDPVATSAGGGPDGAYDPYAYYNDSYDHIAFGAGLSNGKTKTSGEQVNAAWGSFGMGDWVDPISGQRNKGIAAEGGVYKTGEELRDGLGWDFGVGTAQANATTNDSTTGIGASANLIEGSVTLGDEEENIRGGLSMGAGAAARLHYGDADGDGIMEAGFGVDYGVGSFDIRSETIGEAVNYIRDADLPGAWW